MLIIGFPEEVEHNKTDNGDIEIVLKLQEHFPRLRPLVNLYFLRRRHVQGGLLSDVIIDVLADKVEGEDTEDDDLGREDVDLWLFLLLLR